MPIYEYSCQECQRDFETLVRGSAAGVSTSDVRCPACSGARVSRKLSAFATVSSGGGGSDLPPMAGAGCGRCGDPQGPCGN